MECKLKVGGLKDKARKLKGLLRSRRKIWMSMESVGVGERELGEAKGIG